MHPFKEITDELCRQGFERDYKQCRERVKALKKRYKETVDRPRRSGVSVDDDNDLEDVDVQFWWFAEIHRLMGVRAAVNPPEVLDTSDCAGTEEEQGAGGQSEEQPDPSGLQTEEQPGPSRLQTEKQEGSSGRREEQQSPTPTVQSEEQQDPSAQSGEQLGPSRASSREQSGSAGPQAKKRKLTKMDKMEKSNKELVDVLLQAQEESQRGFMELEKKRMEWHAEQARREDQKEVQFMAFVRDVLAMFVPPQPMPYYPPTMQSAYLIPSVPPANPPFIPVQPPNPQDEEEEEESGHEQDS